MGANLPSLGQYVMTERKVGQGSIDEHILSVHDNESYETI